MSGHGQVSKELTKPGLSGENFVPYIPAEDHLPEFTWRAMIVGIIVGCIFGAANAYLGLKVGLTVSASIPAAVIAVAFFKAIRRGNILEANIVQTIGSAGESLAAGVIFTIPAFFIWQMDPGQIKIFAIALIGGVLGVLFMIPLRQYLIVKEHGNLPFPEGTACAEILISSQSATGNASLLFAGLGVGAIYQMLMHERLLGLWKTDPGFDIPGYSKAHFGAEVTPELLGVGYIIGPRIAAIMFAGGVMGVLVLVPLIALIGAADPVIAEMSASAIRGKYVKMIGAGAVGAAGIITMIKSIPIIWQSFAQGIRVLADGKQVNQKRTMQDISMKNVLIAVVVIGVVMVVLPKSIFSVGILGAICTIIFAFFFTTVSSRIVGLIGSSSNPISGMTIATLLMTAALFVAFGYSGDIDATKAAVLSIGGIVCIAAAIAGDTSQDLKTGFLIGATPRKQQIGEIVGVATSAIVMAFVIYLFRDAIMSGKLQAPQANLMALVIHGVIAHELPWTLVAVGALLAIVIEMMQLPTLAFAVGLYLPLELSTPIMVGGLIRWVIDRRAAKEGAESTASEKGILYSSGLIAGAALVGVLVTFLVFLGETSPAIGGILEKIESIATEVGDGASYVIFFGLAATLFWATRNKKS